MNEMEEGAAGPWQNRLADARIQTIGVCCPRNAGGCSFLPGMWWTKRSRWFLAAISSETSLPLPCQKQLQGARVLADQPRAREGAKKASSGQPGLETQARRPARSLVAAYMPGCVVHVQPGSVEVCETPSSAPSTGAARFRARARRVPAVLEDAAAAPAGP
jgi:hypothetical protein